ncbi:gamma-glutamyltransferase [Streptomyces sp. SID3343]|uniref:gamma-glutamyltransferase n=1 Tax=Streptomyces sp. SID3343 TaxID=2690260 RepID=UPI00136A0F1D|nr:gamma-glutamyltransferase [Streptomyces sp. SID3343]MYW05848.1 gamma-glutamyltransferase [Streptomyces sp. SID3343]
MALCAALGLALTVPGVASAHPADRPGGPAKQPVATGWGGAVASVDADATAIGLDVLRRGGNAVDAAIATAAALGVTEPYSSGLGGGGYFVYYDARSRTVKTIDGRETAPAKMQQNAFLDPATGLPIPFDQGVNSGLSVGVPGTPQTWNTALRRWGTIGLRDALRPAAALADRGFVVDRTFRDQTAANQSRFDDIAPTAKLFLPGGQPPTVGSVFRNPDLARTYDRLGREGVDWLYRGGLGREVVRTAQQPPMAPGADRVFRPGLIETGDLARYGVIERKPTRVDYRGLDVYSIAPSSSGGSTVGEALDILETTDRRRMDDVTAAHYYLEASRLAFADRNRYVGDPAFVDVPLQGLLSDGFAKERACLIDPNRAAVSPVPPGDPTAPYDRRCAASGTPEASEPTEGLSTTHLVTADRWGNTVSYTLTIEQTGGSAITVPGRGFLLNNELTDFDFAPLTPGVFDPNLPAPGKRPRSSISPTIVLKDGRPFLALGSPGGATIVTTVLQVLDGRLDRGLTLPQAVAAPRLSQRNGAATEVEPGVPAALRAGLQDRGHVLKDNPEIGAVAALEFLRGGRIQAVAEPTRRGGGAAGVVRPGG